MKKLLLALMFCLMATSIFAATITRYVDTGSAGGNGTTTALSGTNAAYASLAAFNAAEKTNLVIGGNSMVVNCAASTSAADTTYNDFAGWTTDSTHTLTINGNLTTGVWDTSKYIYSDAANAMDLTHASYITINKMQIITYKLGVETTKTNLTVSNCIIKAANEIMIGSAANCKFINNVCYPNSGTPAGIEYYGGSLLVANCTIYGFTSFGIWDESGGVITAKNNIAYNNASYDYKGNFAAASTNNLSKDTTAPPLNTYYISKTLTFVSAGTNFNLVSTDTDAIGKGANLSGTFTTDITGTTRATWDIGAFYYQAAATTPAVTHRNSIIYIGGQ